MKKAIAIIGSSFGDEAKGAYTDFFAANNPNSIVIRFNGGAQAGHTVHTPVGTGDGLKHVFHHFGSGSLSNTPTYLSEFFVNHPMVFRQEYDDLLSKVVKPKVYAHPNSLVTTPWDMMLNQLKEMKRHKNGERHGSVGLGFGETIERQENSEFGLLFFELHDRSSLTTKLKLIRNTYFLQSIEKHELQEEFKQIEKVFNSEFILENFMNDVDFFLNTVTAANYCLINDYDTPIFEGAQGLALDMDRGTFPHVTRSNTGMTNVLAILKHLNVSSVDVNYISRSYLTRHGAGYLPNEVESLDGFEIIDETNITHEYQGSIRFAPIDHVELNNRINKDFDLCQNLTGIKFIKHVNFSCLDQIIEESIVIDSVRQSLTKNIYVDFLQMNSAYCSYGPTRNDILKNTQPL